MNRKRSIFGNKPKEGPQKGVFERKLDKYFLFRRKTEPDWSIPKRSAYYLWRLFFLFWITELLAVSLLLLAAGQYPKEVFDDYFQHKILLQLNTVPVVLLVFFLYGLIGRASGAFFLGGGVFLVVCLANFYKIAFRDEPLYFENILLFREAAEMSGKGGYRLFLTMNIILVLVIFLVSTVLLHFLAAGKLRAWGGRAAISTMFLAVIVGCIPTWLNWDTYDSIKNYGHLDKFNPVQAYTAHGAVYPFIQSAADVLEIAPTGYSLEKAASVINTYSSADISEDCKINVIAIMREAYADFSRYNIPGVDFSGYDLYHALEQESYTGNLVTNVFAGGTYDTERSFLTGNYLVHTPHSNANSYMWYLREQGYAVEGAHPGNNWFYSRNAINGYLGFERYRFWEKDFEYLGDQFYYTRDSVLIPEIYKDFQQNKATGKPYFSFSVNFESHGPYPLSADDPTPAVSYGDSTRYLSEDYSSECNSAMSYYLTAIWETDKALAELVDQLREDSEPVVLVTFGDHLPWMGDGNVFYDEMGIDIDPASQEGFLRHYSTRYLIWANDAAKEILGHDVRGEGPDISPCYLMNLLFRKMDWKGPAFLQAMDDMMEQFPVVTINGRYIVNGVFTDVIPEDYQKMFQDFLYLQYYWRHNFLY